MTFYVITHNIMTFYVIVLGVSGPLICSERFRSHDPVTLPHLWNAVREFQLLRERLPVAVKPCGGVGVTREQLWRLHNDGIQVSDPVRVNA